MKELLMEATSGGMSARELKDSVRHDERPEMRYRRGIVAVSLIGMAAMGIVSLLQTGIVKDLPEPKTKVPNFDTKKVNTSEEAYSYGMPDAPLVLVSHATNIAIAAAGPAGRYEDRPWLPLAALFTALPQAAIAAKYLFYQMPKVEKAWCPYCVVDALTHFTTVALTLPEAIRALGVVSGRTEAPQAT